MLPHLPHLQQILDPQLHIFKDIVPQGNSIADLFCLNTPRGTLFGNSNPLDAHHEKQKLPKLKPLDMTSTSPYPAMLPICPPVTSPQRSSRRGSSLGSLICYSSSPPSDSSTNKSRIVMPCQPTWSTWSGILPPRVHKNPTYSSKVFIGGLPWNTTESTLKHAFSKIGSIKIDWPGKDLPASQPKGYAYIIFENEEKVKNLLKCCTQDYSKGNNWYFQMSSRKMKSKQVQVIPWSVSDSNYARVSQKVDPQKTVFVGALHGMINAEALGRIMNDNFGEVIFVGLHTDNFNYPTGSGKVIFKSSKSYMRAVLAAYVIVETPTFIKKIQIDPYLEDSLCSSCLVQEGPYFCRTCLRYFCHKCWNWQHSTEGLRNHKLLRRKSTRLHAPQHLMLRD